VRPSGSLPRQVGSGETFDDLDYLVSSIPLMAGEGKELPGSDDDRSPFRCAGNRHSSSTAELQKPFISEQPEGPEDGIGVDAQDGGQVSGRRHAFTRSSLTVGDGASDLSGHLIVESQRVGTINLDIRDDAI
jgi:hypothetical protein